jgi:hypothetical protein
MKISKDIGWSVLGLSLLFSAGSAFGQKGVDTQTEKIKQDANKTTSRATDATRSFDWGKGKTRVRQPLPNPYKLSGRRDVLIAAIVDVLKERKLIVDEAASRFKDGIIVTQPYVFAKGAVIAQSELSRYAVLQNSDTSWTRGQLTFTIEIQSIDGAKNNVYINAKVEGRSGNGLISEWTSLQSSGLAEDDLMSKIVEAVTGVSPEPTQDTAN